MSQMAAFAERMATVAVPTMLRRAFGTDWKENMLDLATEMSKVSTRRHNLTVERASAVLAYVGGDPEAKTKADNLDHAIAAEDRELKRLGEAREHASEQLAIENQAAAAQAERARVASIRKKTRELHSLAEKCDADLVALRGSVTKMMEQWRALTEVVDNRELNDAMSRSSILATFIVPTVLHDADRHFKNSATVMPNIKFAFAENLPDGDWAVHLYNTRKKTP